MVDGREKPVVCLPFVSSHVTESVHLQLVRVVARVVGTNRIQVLSENREALKDSVMRVGLCCSSTQASKHGQWTHRI